MILFFTLISLFIAAWMYFIGAFDKWPEVVFGKRRTERIAREETRRGYDAHAMNYDLGRIGWHEKIEPRPWLTFQKPTRVWWKPWTWFKRSPRKVIPVGEYTTSIEITDPGVMDFLNSHKPLIPLIEEDVRRRVLAEMQRREEDILFRGSASPFYDSTNMKHGA